jgi:hypothetical protein
MKFFSHAPSEPEKVEKGDKGLDAIKKSILLCSETINKLHNEQVELKDALNKQAEIANKAHVNSNDLGSNLSSLPTEVKEVIVSLNGANKEIEKLKGLIDLFEKKIKDIESDIKEKGKNIDAIISDSSKIKVAVDNNKESLNGAISSAVNILSDRLSPLNVALENVLNKQKDLGVKVNDLNEIVAAVSPLKGKISIVEMLQGKVSDLEKREVALSLLDIKKVITDNSDLGKKMISGKIPGVVWDAEMPPENVFTEFQHQVVGGISHFFFRVMGDTSGVNVKSLVIFLPQGVVVPKGFDVKENNAQFHVNGALYFDPIHGNILPSSAMLKKVKNDWVIVFNCLPCKAVGAMGSVSYLVD